MATRAMWIGVWVWPSFALPDAYDPLAPQPQDLRAHLALVPLVIATAVAVSPRLRAEWLTRYALVCCSLLACR